MASSQSPSQKSMGPALDMPSIRAILVLDNEGNRIATRYYDSQTFADKANQEKFEKKLQRKTRNATARVDAEVSILDSSTIVYKLGSESDVFFYVVGSSEENELMLQAVLDAFTKALASLLKGNTDKATIFEHYELLLLCIDETVDNGIVFETDALAVEERVRMEGAVPEGASSYSEMTVKSAVAAARDALSRNFQSFNGQQE